MPTTASAGTGALPTTLGRLLGGKSWLALQFLLQLVLAFWSLRLIVEAIGPDRAGAYRFALGFRFLQYLFELGASSAVQRQLSEAWTFDRSRVDRAIACGMTFHAAVSLAQVAALAGVAYLAVPHAEFEGESYQLAIRLLWLQAVMAPCFGFASVVSSVLKAARRYDFVARYEVAITVLRFVVLVLGVKAGVEFFWVAAAQTAVMAIVRLAPALLVMIYELAFTPSFRGAVGRPQAARTA